MNLREVINENAVAVNVKAQNKEEVQNDVRCRHS